MADIKYLNKIKSPDFVKSLDEKETDELCAEIRDVLIKTVSESGGHLASNLGVVELTVALHKSFNSPEDRIVFDVGHQIYTHKLLTGRYDEFSTLRHENGISGFSRPTESEHDTFFSGHSGTSVSSALGIACANSISGNSNYSVCVIGDGSFTGGMVYEALNNAGRTNSRLIVILNENEMSISQNVGSLARYLAVIRSKPGYYRIKERTESALNRVPIVGKCLASVVFKMKTGIKNALYESNLFEDLGFRYMGPIDGHNVKQLCEAMYSAKLVNMPVLLHVYTTKGKGYEPAELEPGMFHGVSRFDINSGEASCGDINFSKQFGSYMCEKAKNDKTVCAITAAMSIGTGLSDFEAKYSDRFFDVGIAEEHAVTFASGLAKNGMKPVFAVYSTFLQRSYDQIIHDGTLQGQKMVLAIDRAGFVGEDGETHQGIYDVAFLNSIPDITVYSPASYGEMKRDFDAALYSDSGVVAVRYPRGIEPKFPQNYIDNQGDIIIYGDENAEISIVTYGRISANAAFAIDELLKKGISAKLIKLNKIKPVGTEAVKQAMKCKKVFFFEEGVRSAGVGEKFALLLLEASFKGDYILKAIDDCFVSQAHVCDQIKKYGLDTDSIVSEVSGRVEREFSL